MDNVMSNDGMMNEEMMELMILVLLFVVVSQPKVKDMVNDTVRGLMPNLELEDEDGHPSMVQTGLHGLIFGGLWYLLGELKLRH